jgi:hypothetical protein
VDIRQTIRRLATAAGAAQCPGNSSVNAESETFLHLLRAAFPGNGRTMRGWLRNPAETAKAAKALSFVPMPKRSGSARGGVERVRRRVTSAA